MRTLVWFRGKDLRVADHAPLAEAVAGGGEIIPLFVLDPYFFAPARAQALPHRMQFLLASLEALARNLEHLGSRLLLVAGKSHDVVPRVAAQWQIDRVVAQRWSEPFARERDRQVEAALRMPFELWEGELLRSPDALKPYAVFSAFARAFIAAGDAGKPRPAPKTLPALARGLAGDASLPTLASLGLSANAAVLAGGERAGRERLKRFAGEPIADYERARNALGEEGTSRLSADLKFGTVSPQAVWHATGASRVFHNELLWREFAYATLWHKPAVLETPFRSEWAAFPWTRKEGTPWRAWIDGTTGYPVVDAASRQLLGEGYVHNRARMIAASFLTKHLLIDYRLGEAHYLRWLTDGDWAVNNLNWQWAAGCGCDAQPYFRVFNPVTQGQRHDPDGAYVRRWVPELARLPAQHIHAPWLAPSGVLAAAGVVLDKTYPRPIVDHAEARARFLAVAKAFRAGGTSVLH